MAENEAGARRVAHTQWTAPAAIPPRLLTNLRVPADFQDVADLVSEEQVCERVVCSPDPDVPSRRYSRAGAEERLRPLCRREEAEIVLGVLRGDALSKEPDSRAGDAMELGPRTIRPHSPAAKLLEARSNQGVKSWIVSTSHGKLLGLLFRTDAERALASNEAA